MAVVIQVTLYVYVCNTQHRQSCIFQQICVVPLKGLHETGQSHVLTERGRISYPPRMQA